MRTATAPGDVGWRSSRPRGPCELVDNVASAHPIDFAEVDQRHRSKLMATALRLSGNHATAEDLVQEALVRGMERVAQLAPGSNIAAWLATIVTNLYFDRRRRGRVEQRAVPQLAALRDDLCEMTLVAVPDTALHAAIAALETDLRAVVELCYLQDMRYREAAEQLGVPTGTVSTRLMRARHRMRALLLPPVDEVPQ
jgi:RNA polymerase sigma-70 factor, ECF subfamily